MKAKLKVVLLYAVRAESQKNMFTGKAKFIDVPMGFVHICETHEITDEGGTKLEPATSAMCGVDRSKIGKRWKYSDQRPGHLQMCPDCQDAWQKHPGSPWARWQR